MVNISSLKKAVKKKPKRGSGGNSLPTADKRNPTVDKPEHSEAIPIEPNPEVKAQAQVDPSDKESTASTVVNETTEDSNEPVVQENTTADSSEPKSEKDEKTSENENSKAKSSKNNDNQNYSHSAQRSVKKGKKKEVKPGQRIYPVSFKVSDQHYDDFQDVVFLHSSLNDEIVNDVDVIEEAITLIYEKLKKQMEKGATNLSSALITPKSSTERPHTIPARIDTDHKLKLKECRLLIYKMYNRKKAMSSVIFELGLDILKNKLRNKAKRLEKETA